MPSHLGIDIGGHGLRGVLLDSSGGIQAEEERSFGGAEDRSFDRVAGAIDHLVESLSAASPEAPQSGLGVAVPGFFRPSDGLLLASPNFPGWERLAVGEALAAALDRPVRVDNDAQCALRGEVAVGAGRGFRDITLLTLGTGVGTAFLVDGAVLRGGAATGAEGGHLVLHPNGRPCGCGRRGCLETTVSGPGLARTAEQLASEAGALWPSATAEEVFHVAKGRGSVSQIGRQAVGQWVEDLARGLAAFLHLFGSQRIVLCGGLSHALPRYHEALTEALDRHSLPACRAPDLSIVQGVLGNLSGAVGAAVLARG